MRSRCLTLLTLVFCSSAYGQTYESASQYEASYKCQADRAGGFAHSESGSELAQFRPLAVDFFITHISQLPTESYEDWPVFSDIKEENALKTAFESNVHVKMTHQEGVWTEERGTYYFRASSTNPKSKEHARSSCTITEAKGPNQSAIIKCDTMMFGQFLFNVGTGRFTRVEAGSWHWKNELRSSVFEFGYCDEYYP